MPRHPRRGIGGNRPGVRGGARGLCWGNDRRTRCIRAPWTLRRRRRSALRAQNLSRQTATPGSVPGVLSPQRRPFLGQRSALPLPPHDKTQNGGPKLVVLAAYRNWPVTGGSRRAPHSVAEPPPGERLDGCPRVLRPPSAPMKIDDSTTRSGFITALSDAYLVPRERGLRDLLATVGRRSVRRSSARWPSARCAASGRSCASGAGRARCVATATSGRCGGRAACRGRRRATSPTATTRCGSSSAGSDEAARAEARGQRWEPVPPGAAARGAAAARAGRARGRRGRPPLFGRLRALVPHALTRVIEAAMVNVHVR